MPTKKKSRLVTHPNFLRCYLRVLHDLHTSQSIQIIHVGETFTHQASCMLKNECVYTNAWNSRASNRLREAEKCRNPNCREVNNSFQTSLHCVLPIIGFGCCCQWSVAKDLPSAHTTYAARGSTTRVVAYQSCTKMTLKPFKHRNPLIVYVLRR